MTKRKQKMFDKIDKEYADKNLTSHNYFKDVVARFHYKGFVMRIRKDQATGLYWGRVENTSRRLEYLEKKINKILVKSVKDIEKDLIKREKA